jgi:hypothetical protein
MALACRRRYNRAAVAGYPLSTAKGDFMGRRISIALMVLVLGLGATDAWAQSKPTTPPASDPAEIKLDEATTLRAAALEAKMSALLANFALLQRQAQDMQQEMNKMLEERKKLIGDAGKKANVEVKEPNEWAFDNKGQRYVKVKRTP